MNLYCVIMNLYCVIISLYLSQVKHNIFNFETSDSDVMYNLPIIQGNGMSSSYIIELPSTMAFLNCFLKIKKLLEKFFLQNKIFNICLNIDNSIYRNVARYIQFQH